MINLIPLGLWQLKLKFEDGPINLKILFLKVEKVSEYFICKSKYSIEWELMEKKLKKNLFITEKSNVVISSCIMHFANARKYFEKILHSLTFKLLKSIPSTLTEWF